MKRAPATLPFALAALLFAGAAHAGRGALQSADRLEPKARARLELEIQAARAADPAPFNALATFRAAVPALDQRRRGRMPALTPYLRSMGPSALLPMLELMALAAPPRTDLSDPAHRALRIALLEAVGELRDVRARPVLEAALSTEQEPDVLRAAAAAVGQYQDDEAARSLISQAEKGGERRLAVLAGMGSCRRLATAQALAAALDARPPDAAAKRIARALSDVGNAWAWRTPGVTAKSEETAVREAAAAALVRAYAAYGAEVRGALSNALMVVDAGATPSLVQRAQRTATPEAARALSALLARFEDNPTR